MARTLQERYDFLVSRLEVTDPDYWEGDAFLRMKPFLFGFSTDNPGDLQDITKVIDFAIDSAEWDAEWKAKTDEVK